MSNLRSGGIISAGVVALLSACMGGEIVRSSEPGRYVLWTRNAQILPLTLNLTAAGTEIGQITTATTTPPACGSAGAVTIDAPASGSTDIEVFNLPVFGNATFTLVPTTGCKPMEVPFVPVELRVAATGSGSGQVVSGSRAIDCTISSGVPVSAGCTSIRTLGTKWHLVATPANGSMFVGYKDVCPGVPADADCVVTTAGNVTTLTVEFAPRPVASIDVTVVPSSVTVGQTAQASAVTKDALGNVLSGRTVTWSSSNPAVATIASNGAIATSGAGTVTITGSSEGKSGTATLTVTAFQPSCVSTLTLALGEVRTLADAEKSSFCLSATSLPAEYVLIPFNNSSVAASTAAIRVNGTNTLAPSALRVSVTIPTTSNSLSLRKSSFLHDDEIGEATFRLREYNDLTSALLRFRSSASRTSGKIAPRYITGVPANPAVGAVYSLNSNLAGNTCSDPKQLHPSRVIAVLPHVIVMADTLAPPGGYTSAEMTAFGQAFETSGYPLDTLNFGGPTDIDANGRVVVFFTPGVNTIPGPPGGILGGLFAGRDLFPVANCAGSNEGELFYMPVPDPNRIINGNYSNKSFLASGVLAVLVHEFQHLINAGRRVYVNNASTFEEVWLNEGLSHIAEELLYYQVSGNSPRSNINLATLQSSQAQIDAFNNYQIQNFSRLRSYMIAPETNSAYAQNDALETRGAIWQLLRYASDRKGGVERNTWRALVNSTTAGQANFNNVFGNIVTFTRDWTVAEFTDDFGLSVDSRYSNPSWNFRSIFPAINSGTFPLTTRTLNAPLDLTLSGGAAAYVRFQVVAAAVSLITTTSSGVPLPASVDVIVMRTK